MSDLIDRQIAIEIIDRHIFYDDYDSMDKIDLINAIKNLPSVEKHGRWVTMSGADGVYWACCSECGMATIAKWKYCPFCGAKMGE